MIEDAVISFIKEFGFPSFIAMILLYDKIKSNGQLIKVVENNNNLLKDIKTKLYNGN